MYRWLRDLHLVLGLFAWSFALVYAVSALQMAHPDLLHARSSARTSQITMPAGTPHAPDAVRSLLVAQGVRGQLKQSEHRAGLLTLQIERPGTSYEVTLPDGAGATVATVVEHRSNALGLLNRLHHAVGTSTGFAPSNLWGVLVAAVSLALLGLGISGIWMWLLRRVERRAGLFFLCVSVLYAGGLLLLIRFA